MEPTYTYRSTEAIVGRKNPNGSINISGEEHKQKM